MQLLAQLCHRFWLAADDLLWPSIPRLVTETLAQGAEHYIIFKPPIVLATKVLIAVLSTACSREQKISRSLAQQWQLVSADALEVHRAIPIRHGLNPLAINQTAIGQALQTDQHHIAGKRRGAGIGRVTVAQ